jgi:hypothetical protein
LPKLTYQNKSTMGGKAFPGLTVPRMTHEVYNELLVKCISILHPKYYVRVFSPPEAPSKTDHGDIDLLVASPTHVLAAKDLSEALGAVQNTKTGVTTSFALPLPLECGKEQTYAQLDVHVCREDRVEWETLLTSYGDLMQILGVLNRAAGLTANDKGLYIRVPEVEAYNRKLSMLYLTHDVSKTFEFLGLDPAPYVDKSFKTDEEIFEWCVKGRFYGPKAKDKSNENASDRNRYVKRKMFTRCMNEWIPEHPEIWQNRKDWTRDEVLQEAIKFFSIEDEYSAIVTAHRRKIGEDELLSAIRDTVPDKEKIGIVLRGLKRFVQWKDGSLALCEDLGETPGDKPRWIAEVKLEERDEIVDWIRCNLEEIQRLERDRMKIAQARGMQRIREKSAKGSSGEA